MTTEEQRKLIADVLEHDRRARPPCCTTGITPDLIRFYRSAAPQLATALRDALDREQAMQDALDEFGPGGTNHWRKCFVDDFNEIYDRKLKERKLLK